jgi:hypothetical protein
VNPVRPGSSFLHRRPYTTVRLISDTPDLQWIRKKVQAGSNLCEIIDQIDEIWCRL